MTTTVGTAIRIDNGRFLRQWVPEVGSCFLIQSRFSYSFITSFYFVFLQSLLNKTKLCARNFNEIKNTFLFSIFFINY